MLKESDVPEGHDINLDLIAETIHRVNSIALFARDNNMDEEFNTLVIDCGFLQKDEPSISLNSADVVEDTDAVINPDTTNDIKAEKTAHNEEDEYYDTVVFSTTETSFYSRIVLDILKPVSPQKKTSGILKSHSLHGV